jgi:hypothetical protein
MYSACPAKKGLVDTCTSSCRTLSSQCKRESFGCCSAAVASAQVMQQSRWQPAWLKKASCPYLVPFQSSLNLGIWPSCSIRSLTTLRHLQIRSLGRALPPRLVLLVRPPEPLLSCVREPLEHRSCIWFNLRGAPYSLFLPECHFILSEIACLFQPKGEYSPFFLKEPDGSRQGCTAQWEAHQASV